MDFDETFRLCVKLTREGELVGENVKVQYGLDYIAISNTTLLVEVSNPYEAVVQFNKLETNPDFIRSIEATAGVLVVKSDKEIIEDDDKTSRESYKFMYPIWRGYTVDESFMVFTFLLGG